MDPAPAENHDSPDKISYHYKFIFSNGIGREFNLALDRKTLNLISVPRDSYPEWAELKCFKCPNCSLGESKVRFCPIAVNLIELIDFFKTLLSYEEVEVLIETEARRYMKHTTLQKGLSSLIGIYMVTSGCPVMDKLKPMVRHHLPFATLEETRYRVISMYLLAQYFLFRRGRVPDWELKNLIKIYDDIRIVNKSFCKRLSEIKIKDASVNAVVILDTLADFILFSMDKDTLKDMESQFSAYFK